MNTEPSEGLKLWGVGGIGPSVKQGVLIERILSLIQSGVVGQMPPCPPGAVGPGIV